jgi:hypothetical protein
VRIARLDRDRSTDALEGAQRGSLVRIGGTDGAHVRADRVRIERER